VGVLTRTKLYPNSRYDLEDYLAEQSATRTESHLQVQSFESDTNQIISGFKVTGVGLTQATILMPGSTLMIPQSSTDFSWFVAPSSASNEIITASQLTDGARNYLELSLATQDGTPVTRAFWDPDANSGAGAEFNQTVNTMTDLVVVPVILTGGFSGLPDRLPVAILDVDGSGNIKTIFDRRELFHRLARPENLTYTYPWGSKQEPAYSMILTGVSGVFVAGETLQINTETATCVSGGTTSISFSSPSGINFFNGSLVTGLTSGATGTVDTILESFNGVDKDVANYKQDLDAIKTEIKNIKGSSVKYWWQDAPASLSALDAFQDSLLVQAVVETNILWDGSNMSLLNTTSLSPSASDVLGYIRILGRNDNLGLCRQDGTGGSTVIPLSEKQVVFVQIPSSGSQNYSGVGSGSGNYQVTSLSSYSPSTSTFWIAYRENGLLYIRNGGVLTPGGITPLGGASGSGTGSLQSITCFDPYDTSLPSGPSATIDGHTIVNNDLVIFTNLSSGTNNRVYKATGVGTSIVWVAQSFFNGQLDPSPGNLIEVTTGLNYGTQIGTFNGTTWAFNDVVRHFNSVGDFWQESSIKSVSIPPSSSGAFLTVDQSIVNNLIIHFSLDMGANKDTGLIFVTQNGTSISLSTAGTALGSTGVSFSAAYDGGGNMNVNYTSGVNSGTMKFWVEYWSDSSGGPNGLPQYPTFENVQIGSLNTCYTASDGSGSQVNCSAPTIVLGVTQLHFNFVYTTGVAPGTTSGELEVIVDGAVLPRFVTGVTVDAYYKEVDNQTISFWTNLSSTPVSIEIRRRQGTINTDVSGNPRLLSYYDLVVGSAAEVTNGSADYTSLAAALGAAIAGSKILVLQGTYTENVNITQNVCIQGKGHSTVLNGNITFSTTACLVKDLYINGNIVFTIGSSKNILSDSWIGSGKTLTDSGTSNLYLTLTDG
jgi:hypothetical protein